MQKIIPHLWFTHGIEEAVNLYVSLLPDSEITDTQYYTAQNASAGGMKEGDIMVITFKLAGQKYAGINGGPQEFLGKGTGPVSLLVNCTDQSEIDKLWDALTEGGQELPCGWLTDKYGITWQIVPDNLDKLLANGAWPALLKMTKIVIADLEKTAKG